MYWGGLDDFARHAGKRGRGEFPAVVAKPRRHASRIWPQRQENRKLLARAPFSSYVICMGSQETISGIPVTEEQIQAWADEAEAGYDVEALKKRGRGRPGRGAEPSQVVALRLTLNELAALDARAEREGKTRSEIIREALAASAA